MENLTKLERAKSLCERTFDELRNAILAMAPGENKLPSEDELSRALGVSRSTIREAVKQLQMEGAITKIQGRGTFAHPSVFHIQNRVDLHPDFYALLSREHERVVLDVEPLGVSTPSESYLRVFPNAVAGEPVYVMVWRYYADDILMIFGTFEFPTRFLRRIPAPDFHVNNLPEFSKAYLNEDITYCAMQLRCGYSETAARQFGIPEKVPMQCWKEVIYDVGDHAVGYCRFFLHPDHMIMSLIAHFDI
ncbi:MAG: GntR family transcriptional regulator [Bacillota bacterium]